MVYFSSLRPKKEINFNPIIAPQTLPQRKKKRFSLVSLKSQANSTPKRKSLYPFNLRKYIPTPTPLTQHSIEEEIAPQPAASPARALNRPPAAIAA